MMSDEKSSATERAYLKRLIQERCFELDTSGLRLVAIVAHLRAYPDQAEALLAKLEGTNAEAFAWHPMLIRRTQDWGSRVGTQNWAVGTMT